MGLYSYAVVERGKYGLIIEYSCFYYRTIQPVQTSNQTCAQHWVTS